jgi:hypothetical protein
MKRFTKNDLKTGMSVILKNGMKGRVIENVKIKNFNSRPFVIFLFDSGYVISDNYDSELRSMDKDEGYDIEKIFDIESDENLIDKDITRKLIWERDVIEIIIKINGMIENVYIISEEDLNYIKNGLEELKIKKM